MADENLTIYVDDVSGNQIESPDKAKNGGARILRRAEAETWLKANPERALKAAAKSEDKEMPKASNKGHKPD